MNTPLTPLKGGIPANPPLRGAGGGRWLLRGNRNKEKFQLRFGIRRLPGMIPDYKIARLVLTHKDRLLRSGAELVFALCELRQVEVVIISKPENTSSEEEPASDVPEIITVFSARLYGSRSHRNRKIKECPAEIMNGNSAES